MSPASFSPSRGCLPFLFLLVAYFPACFSPSLFAERRSAADTFSDFSPEFLNQRYLEPRLEHLLENFSEFSTYQMEITGNFGAPDPLLYSIYGGSSLWNRFFFDGHRMDSRLQPGQPFFRPFATGTRTSFDLYGFDARLSLEQATNRYSISGFFGGLGGAVPGADTLVKVLGGYDAPNQRGHLPPNDRRKVRQILQANQETILTDATSRWLIGSEAYWGQRDFLSYGVDGATGTFTEGFGKASFFALRQAKEESPFPQMGFFASFLARDQTGAEVYVNHLETFKSTRAALGFFASDTHRFLEWNAGLNLGWNSDLTRTNFSRNVFDLDGESRDPWRPSGNGLEATLHHHLRLRAPERLWGKMSASLEGYNSLVGESPLRSGETNAFYFQRRGENAIPLGVTFYSPKAFSFGVLENALSLVWEKKIGPEVLSFFLRGALTLDGLILGSESLARINVEWEARANLLPKNIFETEFAIGRKRIPFDATLARQLSDNYFPGETYFWNDANANLSYEAGESTGRLSKTTGGASTSAASDLREPYFYYFQMPLILRFHPAWTFRIVPTYRSYRDQLWVHYRGDANQYGSTVNVGGLEAPVFVTGGASAYEVGNFPGGLLPNAFLFSDPFYAGALLRLDGHGKNWFFSFSFNALMVMGATTTGIGAVDNSLGTLTERMADPEAQKFRAVGRLDPDRGYVARIFFSHTIAKRFDYAVQLKYRDGQPFSPYSDRVVTNANGDRTAIFLPDRVHGDNPFNGEFGNREDSAWDLGIRMRYRQPLARGELSFLLSFENVFDIASTLQEFNLYEFETRRRAALEIQIPRSVAFTVGYSY